MNQHDTNRRMNDLTISVARLLRDSNATKVEIALVCAALTGIALSMLPMKTRKQTLQLINKYQNRLMVKED